RLLRRRRLRLGRFFLALFRAGDHRERDGPSQERDPLRPHRDHHDPIPPPCYGNSPRASIASETRWMPSISVAVRMSVLNLFLKLMHSRNDSLSARKSRSLISLPLQKNA